MSKLSSFLYAIRYSNGVFSEPFVARDDSDACDKIRESLKGVTLQSFHKTAELTRIADYDPLSDHSPVNDVLCDPVVAIGDLTSDFAVEDSDYD